ncbi:MAG: tol-pal system-associated acyl-CoA thioesterase [Rhodospirillaceae bacterium]
MASPMHIYFVRVYHEDTDSGGIVYYANYLRFAERARTEMLRSVGLQHPSMIQNCGLAFVVRSCNAEYLKPAHLDDELKICTGNIVLEAASLWLSQSVHRLDDILVNMQLRLACVDRHGRPKRLSKILRQNLLKFQSKVSG